jgi:hypothetical protein
VSNKIKGPCSTGTDLINLIHVMQKQIFEYNRGKGDGKVVSVYNLNA